MRKLATIREVMDVSPIEGADLIELVKIAGWQCVAKKGEFKPGDAGVYFEIDSFLPIEPRYEFLRKSCYKKMPDGTEGFRIKTIRLRGVLSQGLMMPLHQFPGLGSIPLATFPPELVGIATRWGASCGDVTAQLGITKYEPPIPPQLAGTIKGMFPTKIGKTDQERIQNLWTEYRDRYGDVLFEVSVKLDGASMTVYHDDGDFGVCSRGLDLKEDDRNSFWRMARKLCLREVLSAYNKPIVLQGELAGPGIEGNRGKLDKIGFYIFDIWDIEKQRHYDPITRRAILYELNGILTKISVGIVEEYIQHVPVIDLQAFRKLSSFESLDHLLAYADGSSLNPTSKREGIVFKSLEHIGGRIISFKVNSNAYLLKEPAHA